MGEIQVSMTDLRQSLDDLVNQAAYRGERIVLVLDGEPRAAIIGMNELRRLDRANAGESGQRDRFTQALENADRLRERIRRWQTAHGIEPGDSVEDLRQMREERDAVSYF